MIGLVIVTHGLLGQELINALEHVVGRQSNITAICIGPDDDMEKKRDQIIESVANAEEGNGVILLTDMFGGTPSNLAISILGSANVEVIAGVNLPMLIKLASVRQTESLEDAAQSAQEAGRKYINIASRLLTQEDA
jgi:PTS system mannose-specific IIA component